MGLGLGLIVMGSLIFLDRMGAGYGLREGWPWIVVALGAGGVFQNRKSIAAWVTMVIGILIVGGKYYSIHIPVPRVMKLYFLPVLLMIIGLFWVLRHKKD